MNDKKEVKVLSLNSYIMGHITYQNILEIIFDRDIPDVDFESLHLSDYKIKSYLKKILFFLFSKKILPTKDDYEFHRFRAELGISFFARHYLENYLKSYQPDVIHLHTQGIALLAGQILRRFPSVVSIDYTTALLAKEHPFPAQITYQPIVALERKCFQLATHIISCSERARQSVISDYGIAPEKVTHIDYPLFLEMFIIMNRSHKSADSKPRLLFVGNDFTRKGGEDLLTVFLEDFAETCELDLVTNADIQLPIMQNIRIHKGIRPLSFELLNLYQAADIFVMPTHEDVYGIVFQEAMAAGLPCIGTTVMAVPELVHHGKNGFTVGCGDRQALSIAIHKLVNDPDLRLSMGLAGRDIAINNFDPIQNCQRLAKIFSTCAEQAKVS